MITSSSLLPSFQEYYHSVLDLCDPLPAHTIKSTAAHRQYLACDVVARQAVPPFDSSAVDGFAVHRNDLHSSGPWVFPVIGDVPAGQAPIFVKPGTALRIMTGAALHPDNNSHIIVVPVEQTNASRNQQLPATVTIHQANRERSNIRYAGEHINVGDLILRAGSFIDSGAIATLVATGISHITAHRHVRVALLTTGDEVQTSCSTSIPNSNAPMARTILQNIGAEVIHHHVRDCPDYLVKTLHSLTQKTDIIVTIGGVSAGAYDVVRQVLTQADTSWCGKIALRPGAPQGQGRWNNIPVLSLPGNPVAAWTSLHLFVIPAIKLLSGLPREELESQRPQISLYAAQDFPSVPSCLTRATPVRIDWNAQLAYPCSQGSHAMGSLPGCTGLVLHQKIIRTHDSVTALLL